MSHHNLLIHGFAAIALLFAAPRLAADPATDQFNFAEGVFAYRDYPSAAEEYRAYLDKYPQGAKAGAASFRYAECQFRLNDFKQAVTAFEQALKAYPQAAEAALGSYNLARAHLSLDQIEAALEAFRFAQKQGTGEVVEEAIVGEAECLIKLERHAEAVQIYAKFLAAYPDSKHRADLMFSQGWTLATLLNHAEAAKVFEAFLAAYPEHKLAAKARLALSDAYSAAGEFDKSKTILEDLVKGNKEGEEAMLRLAWNMFQTGQREQAADTFVAFADKYPDSQLNAAALYNAGVARYELKQFKPAVELMRRLQKQRPDSTEAQQARFWIVLCLFETGDFAAAAGSAAELLAQPGLDPEKQASLLYTRAEALAAQQQTAAAVPIFEQLLAAHPTSRYAENALYSLALGQQSLNRLDDAIKTLQRLLAEFPETTLRHHALFALSEYLYRADRFADALEPLQQLAAQPDAAEKSIYRLAWVNFELGKFAEALKRFEGLTTGDSEFRNEAWYMCGRASESLEQLPQAIGFYEKLTALGGNDSFTEKAFHRLGFLYDRVRMAANLEAYRKKFPRGEFGSALALKLAEVSFADGELKTAIALYQQLLTEQNLSEATRQSANYGLGWCLLDQDDLDAADQAFAKVKTEPLTTDLVQDALLQRGEIAYRQERYPDAVAAFSQLADIESIRGERALYMLGWSTRRQEDWPGSVGPFSKLLERFPDTEFKTDAAIRLGEALQRAGELDRAREVLHSAIANADPELAEELYHLYADTLVRAREWQEVIDVCKQMQQQFPESPRLYLVLFRLGLAHKEIGLGEQAIGFFRQTQELTETIEAAQAQFNIGAIYFSQGDFSSSAKNFLRVEMLYDYADLSPKSLYHAIEAFYKAGDDQQRRASIYIDKLKEKYPESEWTAKAVELTAANAE